jgi:hypothetical protein
MDYQEAYTILFRGITEALEELDKSSDKSSEVVKAEMVLQSVQRKTEDMYIEAE